jgi:hypothetical protein
LARVGASTLNEWLERGETGEQPYADFLGAYEMSEAQLESELVGK